MEQSLQQCKQDFIQYEQFFQNIIKEVCLFILFLFIFLLNYSRFESYNMNMRKNRLFVRKFSFLFFCYYSYFV